MDYLISKYLEDFPVIILLLFSNLILLWSENLLGMISILFKFIESYFMT